MTMHTMRGATELFTLQPDFRRLVAAQSLAQAADGIAQAAFYATLLLDPFGQQTPEKILGLFVLTLLPYSLLAPFLGVFVDRWSRRALLTGTNVLRAILLMTLPLWAAAVPGDLEIYLGILLLLGLGRLFLTTKGAVLPVVLGEHHLLRGNAISGGVGMISALAGGVVGLIVAGFVEGDSVFVIAGLAYVLAAAIARTVKSPLVHPHPSRRGLLAAMRSVARDLVAGLVAIWRRDRARLPLGGIFLLRTVVMFIAVAAILLIRIEFPGEIGRGGRLSASGVALAGAGIGAFLAALSAPVLGLRYSKPGLIVLGFVVSGTGIVALGGIQNLYAIVALTLVGGYGSFVSKVATDAQVQEALPDEYRGRAFALYDILYNLASIVAGGVMVAFQDRPIRLVLVVTGVVTLAMAVGLAHLMRRAGMALGARAAAPASSAEVS